ncbi:hypothetical protein Ancab_038905, partial [Ancistrocladus abbreviatus]
VLQGLDSALSCVEDMNEWLGIFNVKLRHMREDIESISEVLWDCSLHGEIENHKDSPSSAVADASGESRRKRSFSKWKDDLSPASSTVTESNQAGELISGSKLPTECMLLLYFTVAPRGEMTMSDEMDLLVEQEKMLAGAIAFNMSTLKRLLE